MKVITYQSGSIPYSVLEAVANLLHESFAERRAQGLNFKCGQYSAQDVENDFAGGGWLLVIYEDSVIIGTLSLIQRCKQNNRYLSHDNLAIADSYKGKGIAGLLFKEALHIAKDNDFDFLTSFTATTAESSVKYHLKMGFIIYCKSFGIGYNSYSFIYPLKKYFFLRNSIMRFCVYSLKTTIGYIIKKIKK